MSRELKFRVWNPEQKKFEYFELHTITVPDRLLTQHKFPVQQFSGKLDIEEKEMYEGDFVELIFALQTHPETGEKNLSPDSYGLYEVIYNENEARFKLKIHRENKLKHHDCADNSIPISEVRGICKVIGNIFETPELLKNES